jgi:hypothetical protein
MHKIRFKLLLILLVTVTLNVKASPVPDIYDEISNAIRSGDAKQVSAFFGSTVDLTIISQEDMYSKAQAEIMLKEFFAKNPVKTFSIVHKGSSKDGILFTVGNYISTNGNTYRTSIVLKSSQGKYIIQQLRFEKQ